MSRIPTYLDRYPAKMVSHLASGLLDRYVGDPNDCFNLHVFDPFCGSGAILVAAAQRGISVTGSDLSPFAQLLAEAKLNSFRASVVTDLVDDLIRRARGSDDKLPMRLPSKEYWFASKTLDGIERLRAKAREMRFERHTEGRVAMLAFALSMRLCSFADQRSPKPFISQHARTTRVGQCFDPFLILSTVARQLVDVYSRRFRCSGASSVHQVDIASGHEQFELKRFEQPSHVLTSPPYINAQDYFRNSKFELYALEGVLPFDVSRIRNRFIGTERGPKDDDLPKGAYSEHLGLLPELAQIEERSARAAQIVHKYLYSMHRAFANVTRCLRPEGRLILVCGDNLVAGVHVLTWRVLADILERQGYIMFDRFSDTIKNRHVPPKRQGHRGLIKDEVVCAFQRKD